MKHRKLRIAWSVTWGIVAVLLIALWVRSYWRTDYFVAQVFNGPYVQLSLMPGTFGVFASAETGVPSGTVIHVSSEEWMRNFEIQRAAGAWSMGNHWSRVWGTFYFQNGQNVPYWFIVVITAALGGSPWWKGRFSLRTLLITTTFVAVGLGLIVWAVRK